MLMSALEDTPSGRNLAVVAAAASYRRTSRGFHGDDQYRTASLNTPPQPPYRFHDTPDATRVGHAEFLRPMRAWRFRDCHGDIDCLFAAGVVHHRRRREDAVDSNRFKSMQPQTAIRRPPSSRIALILKRVGRP